MQIGAGQALLVVNPRAARLRRGPLAADIAAARLRSDVQTVETQRPGHAQEFCRAHAAQFARIIVVGGDGLFSEALNGAMQAGAETALAPVAAGTGCDFARAMPGYPAPLSRLLDAQGYFTVDLGQVTGAAGQPRWFATEAGVGLDAACLQFLPRWLLGLSPRWAYTIAALLAVAQGRAFPARVRFDDEVVDYRRLQLLAVCTTEYFGNAIPIAPQADPHDGLFDVITIAEGSRLELLANFRLLMTGRHVEHPKVSCRRARRVELQTDVPQLLCRDGDGDACAPHTWETLPGRLRVVDPRT